jgi:hypothetical protein
MHEIGDLSVELFEEMMDRNDQEVVALCDLIIERINLIKEYHTDETLLP